MVFQQKYILTMDVLRQKHIRIMMLDAKVLIVHILLLVII